MRLRVREGDCEASRFYGLRSVCHSVGSVRRGRQRAAEDLLAPPHPPAGGHHPARAGGPGPAGHPGQAGPPRSVGAGEQRWSVCELRRRRAVADVKLPRLHGGQLLRHAECHQELPAAAATGQRSHHHHLQPCRRSAVSVSGSVRSVESSSQPPHRHPAPRAGALGGAGVHHPAVLVQDRPVHQPGLLGEAARPAAAGSESGAAPGLRRGLRDRDQGLVPELRQPRQPRPDPCGRRHRPCAAGASAPGAVLRGTRRGAHVLHPQLLPLQHQHPLPPETVCEEDADAAHPEEAVQLRAEPQPPQQQQQQQQRGGEAQVAVVETTRGPLLTAVTCTSVCCSNC